MATKHVTIPNIGPVTLYKRKGNQSIRLSISLEGEIRVSMPHWLPYKAGEEFAASKAVWLATHQQKRVSMLEHGQHIGKAHRLYFEPGTGKSASARVTPTEIRIHHPRHAAISDESVQKRARVASIRALRQEAEHLLPGRLRRLAQEHGFDFRSVQVKQLKSRWGSCSSEQDITLNLFLMQLPWHLIDYVLLHELTHTRVMQHGQPFWDVLEEHLPNARARRQEINTHQPILSAIPLTVA
jgi:predicted metal-dependent hydrolase